MKAVTKEEIDTLMDVHRASYGFATDDMDTVRDQSREAIHYGHAQFARCPGDVARDAQPACQRRMPNHTVLSYDVTAEQMKDWATMMDIEFVHIDRDTTVEKLEQRLFLNDLAWKLK